MTDLKNELKTRLKALVSESSNQLSNDVTALFESTSIAESEQKKFLDIIEATVNSKAVSIAESSIIELSENVEEYAEYIKEELEVKADEYGQYVVEETTNKLDAYLTHVAESFIKENELAVTNGIKADLFESLVISMKEIFVENNIVVPEDGVDIVAELQEEVTERDATNDKLVTENADLKTKLIGFNKTNAINEAVKQLADTQVEKVLELTESLEYNDEFEAKLKNIVEFASDGKSTIDLVENIQDVNKKTIIAESTTLEHNKTSSNMNAYIQSAVGSSSFQS